MRPPIKETPMSRTDAVVTKHDNRLTEMLKVGRDVIVAIAPTVTVIVAAKVISDHLKKD
jgi:hypothetical protein